MFPVMLCNGIFEVMNGQAAISFNLMYGVSNRVCVDKILVFIHEGEPHLC
jgi:hypothetical protein